MNQGREIHSFDYVNHPYTRVRDALTADPAAVFRAATKAAASRAESVATELRVTVAGLEIGAEVVLSIGAIEESRQADSSRVTRIPVEWEAAERPRLFPLMNAQLSVYSLTARETQLDFLGQYNPPLGLLGGAMDAVMGHRIAEASVHRLVADVARYLRQALT
jgi:hypothetical protein